MVEQKEEVDDPEQDLVPKEKSEEEDLSELELDTTIFAIRTTMNQESNVLQQIFYRFRILDTIPDIKAMIVTPLLPGYIFFEAPQKRDVQIAIKGVPHIKGRIISQIGLKSIMRHLIPRSVTEYLHTGDTVEIISGVFEGSRAVVMRMPHDSSSSEEVVVRLLQEETPITIKIHGDYLKLVEKKEEEEEEEEIPEVKVSAQETYSDLEEALSFDDEFESEYEEEVTESVEAKKEDWKEEEWEEEEEDEWSKFDGF
ncbi:MAG: Transcription elongation factor Spt5 [Promethearchaeota archaeon]|nr:MAG: Transcription elongation factor Spt5 [Candidatus Lokiarchaeota archaeon]